MNVLVVPCMFLNVFFGRGVFKTELIQKISCREWIWVSVGKGEGRNHGFRRWPSRICQLSVFLVTASREQGTREGTENKIANSKKEIKNNNIAGIDPFVLLLALQSYTFYENSEMTTKHDICCGIINDMRMILFYSRTMPWGLTVF